MVEKEGKCSLNVTFDQHEAIIGMKRGKDTVYDVMDRLIEREHRISDLERQFEGLDMSFTLMHNAVKQLKKEMIKCHS
jgi:predicted CopG family antitoxin